MHTSTAVLCDRSTRHTERLYYYTNSPHFAVIEICTLTILMRAFVLWMSPLGWCFPFGHTLFCVDPSYYGRDYKYKSCDPLYICDRCGALLASGTNKCAVRCLNNEPNAVRICFSLLDSMSIRSKLGAARCNRIYTILYSTILPPHLLRQIITDVVLPHCCAQNRASKHSNYLLC